VAIANVCPCQPRHSDPLRFKLWSGPDLVLPDPDEYLYCQVRISYPKLRLNKTYLQEEKAV
jgi:hypothetical protein